MSSSDLPNYDQFCVILEQLELPETPAELHGRLCGYLCANSQHKAQEMLTTLLGTGHSDQEAVKSINELLATSAQQLNASDLNFQLLLPNDDDDLSQRTAELGSWCRAFCQSLNDCHIHIQDLNEEDSQEALAHIQEFSEVDSDDLNIDEENEKALTELHEYLRMAVLMIFTELTKPVHQSNGTVH